ncbi:MAG: hypothetical protein ABW106_04600 [Steroidobacteraceae bacterium]
MKIRSRLFASLVAGLSLATCAAHADPAPFRYGPKDTLVKEQATQPKASTTERSTRDTQRSYLVSTQATKERGQQIFTAGPRNTILIDRSPEAAMLSHER